MPTNILCKQAASATFSANHKDTGKTFVSNQPPLTREDYPQLKANGFTNSAGTKAVGYGTPEPFYSASSPGYRLLRAISQFGYPIEIFVNGALARTVTNFEADDNDPADALVFAAGDQVTARCPTCPPFQNYLIYRLMAYTDAWGHKVTDRAGQTEIFLTGSATKPAPFNSSCGNQCPPGQVRCGDCCLDCKSIAGQIAAIGSRLITAA